MAVIAERISSWPLVIAIMLGPTALFSPGIAFAMQTAPVGVSQSRPDQMPGAHIRTDKSPAVPPPANPSFKPPALAPFRLKQVVVEGSSLASDLFVRAAHPFIGSMVDEEQLAALVQSLAALYAQSDIALYSVTVPQQSVSDGTLRVVAIEGHIEGATIRGNARSRSIKLLQVYLAKIQGEQPLSRTIFERTVSLIRDIPGLTTNLSLKGGSRPGVLALEVAVAERPVQASLAVDNRGTALLGRTQLNMDIDFNGVLLGGDQLRLSTIMAVADDRLQYHSLTYQAPIDHDGTVVSGVIGHVRSRPSILPLAGRATSVGIQLSRPIIRANARSLTVTGGIDASASRTTLLGFTLSQERVRSLRLAAAYAMLSPRRQMSIGVTGSVGLSLAGSQATPRQSDRKFSKVTIRASAAQAIGANAAVRLNAFGQITGDRLPSLEQVALGGDEFGRGFEASIIGGDTGVAGSAELAWRPPVGLPPALAGSEFYLFADGGRVTYKSRLGFDSVTADLASAGIGARLPIHKNHLLETEFTRALSRPLAFVPPAKTRLVISFKSSF